MVSAKGHPVRQIVYQIFTKPLLLNPIKMCFVSSGIKAFEVSI